MVGHSGRKNCGSERSATPIFSDAGTSPDSASRPMKQLAHPTSAQPAGGIGSEPRIVLVEDDTLFRELVETELSIQGFAVLAFSDAESLLAAGDVASSADAIVLDWQLPGLSGAELFAELQRRGIDNPVIFLTAYPLVENERRAFLAGAADFIDKTRGFDVLVRRLNLIVNAAPGARVQRRLERRGRLLLNPVEGRAFWDDVDVALTLGEYRIVELLARRSPAHATYREIHEQIRHQTGAAATEDECRLNARAAVRRIRVKFGACDPAFSQIENYQALGYLWRSAEPAND
jgi:two-component system response regulator ChvI